MLYDVSSAAFEGRTCPLGAVGHPKDGVRGRLQIVYGLLTSTEGVPVVIEVFAGNTGDPTTVKSQVDKVKDRFGITRVVLVGDRGMLTAARLREDVAPEGLDWITALRSPQVKKLVRDGALQLLDAQTGSTGTREPLARGGQGGRLLHVTRRERQVWALIFIALAAFLSGGNRLMSKRPQTARPVDSPRLTDCYRGE